MPSTHHHATEKKPLAMRLLMYVILLGVIITGLFMLKPFLLKKETPKPPCQYDKNVCEYLSHLEQAETYYAGPFTVSITTTQANGDQSRIAVRSDAYNNLDIIRYDENIFTGHSIYIDNTIYVKDMETNTWRKTNDPMNPALLYVKKQAIEEVFKSGEGITYTFIGDNECGDKTCMKYQLVTDKNTPVKTYVLFTTTTHALKEIIKEFPDGTKTNIVFVYTDVTVTPPPTL